MGVDFLDLSFEVEKQFGIRLEPDDLRPVWMTHGGDCTVGNLHDLIVEKCRSANVPVPRTSWNRLRIALVKSLGVRVDRIKRDAWLRRDLDFY
jgi:hypothetical protein